ncbi:MAG: hypothetical protein WCT52_06065, partial [Candidatus Micrarchaeia archaeon]
MKRFLPIITAFLLLSCMAGTASAMDILPTYLPDGYISVPYSQQFQVTGGTGPFSFTATGLPSGLSITSDGTVYGTPSQAVDLTNIGFTVSVLDEGTGEGMSKGIGIKINAADSIDVQPTYLPDGEVGVPYSQSLTATGGVPPYTFSATGLSSGLSISSSGVVFGTPTATGTGFTVHVADSVGPGIYKGIGLKINAAQDTQDVSPPSLSVSVAPYTPSGGNTYTISAYASDNSGLTDISIYLAQGSIGGHGAFSKVKSCTGEPCAYTSGDNSGSYVY